ncbi:hypothetical protein HSX10_14935 [Winogradskyella undariae]|uniref:hypothetical protein n=1 Tax=Winogradskyella undariae TaxID=1285465 RepID=UPI00156B9FF5|nr:hypothetical protein [Winogradskyella undariae]NRR92867.1 hypothetical protein [Winogradskyella undariae]
MSKIIFLIFISILFSCSGIKTVNYDKARKLNLKKGYKTVLNENEEIDLKKYYLAPKNISKVTVDRKSEIIKISQINSATESFSISEIESKKFKSRYKIQTNDSISLVILNGILVEGNDKKKYKIDYDVVKTVTLLKDASSTILNCGSNDGVNVLLITTE